VGAVLSSSGSSEVTPGRARKRRCGLDAATWGVVRRALVIVGATVAAVTAVSLILLAAVPAFGVSVWTVLGSSMEPTLDDGSIVAVRNSDRPIQHGEIMVVGKPESWYREGKDASSHRDVLVKRVAAVPGDTLEVVGGEIRVNGTVVYSLKESGYPCPAVTGDYRHTLGAGEVMVLGDNAFFSLDSRKVMCTMGTGGMFVDARQVRAHGRILAST